MWSIINRSPKELLQQIILVDDASTKDFLKEPLQEYLRKARIDHIVKVVRTQKREGLIRARQIGARAATADIMVCIFYYFSVDLFKSLTFIKGLSRRALGSELQLAAAIGRADRPGLSHGRLSVR